MLTDSESLVRHKPINKNITQHKNWNLLPQNCGMATRSRIIGGKKAGLGQFPWLARLGYRKKQNIQFLCGGALIKDTCVLTAAHCIKGYEKSM